MALKEQRCCYKASAAMFACKLFVLFGMIVPTKPMHSTCDELTTCLGSTCDAQIEKNSALTCAELEKDGCNCKNCLWLGLGFMV